MTSSNFRRRARTTGGIAAVAVVAAALTSCSATTADSPDADGLTDVTFALNYIPTAGEMGVYVAMAKGYYEDAGLDVSVLPYGQTSGLTIVGAGTADFTDPGMGDVVIAAAAGLPVESVMAIDRHNQAVIAIRAGNTDIERPRDLDGKKYGAIGLPIEDAINRTVIKNDGGTADYTNVTLGVSSYDALYSDSVDFVQPFLTTDVIQAELLDQPLTIFDPLDYGYPDNYAAVLAVNSQFADDNPETTAAFTAATVKGYAYAQENPEEAAQITVDANPGTDLELTKRAAIAIANDRLLDGSGVIGTQDQEMWDGYVRFMYENGLLADEAGAPLAAAPDSSGWWNNDFLPTGG